MTAPTPMMMPSIVSADRILLRPSARIAILKMARGSFFVLSSVCREFFSAPRAASLRSIDRFVAMNAAVAKMDHAFGVLRNIGFMGDDESS